MSCAPFIRPPANPLLFKECGAGLIRKIRSFFQNIMEDRMARAAYGYPATLMNYLRCWTGIGVNKAGVPVDYLDTEI